MGNHFCFSIKNDLRNIGIFINKVRENSISSSYAETNMLAFSRYLISISWLLALRIVLHIRRLFNIRCSLIYVHICHNIQNTGDYFFFFFYLMAFQASVCDGWPSFMHFYHSFLSFASPFNFLKLFSLLSPISHILSIQVFLGLHFSSS